MARRASKKTNKGVLFGVAGGLLVILVVAIFAVGGSGRGNSSGVSDFPIDEYFTRGSILRDNTYSVSGRVDERITRGDGELVVVQVKKTGGAQELLPILVYQGSKSINIERNQEYDFKVRVVSKGDQKGLLVAESVSEAR